MLETELKPRGLYPNIIVNSGHGVHLYWIFDSFILTQITDEMLDPKSLLKKIQSIIRQLADPFVVDDTASLSHMFRIPGSVNWKGDPENAPIATVIRDDGKTFDVEDLASKINFALDELQDVSRNVSPMSDKNIRAVEKMRSRGISESLVSNGNFKLMIENCAFIRHVVENFNTTPEPILKDALTNLLRASNARDYVIQLCKDCFGADFDEDFTNKRLTHYETQKPTTCKKIHETCNACILDDCRVFQLGKKVPAAIVTSNEVKSAIESSDKTLGDCVDDVPENLASFKIPFGYLVSDSGIQKVNNRDSTMWSLCFVSKIYYEFDSVDGRKTFYQMTARINHRWDRFDVPAKSIKDSRNVVETLSDCGVEIDSNVAKSAIAFFTAFASTNEDLIPHVTRFTKTGWNSNQFVIPRDDVDFEVKSGSSLHYLYSAGSREKSIDLINRGLEYTAVKVLVAASLAATFISKINCRNFTINIQAKTETGKTAAMRLASSIWGNPRFMITLNATNNAAEFAATERNCLPLLANEFQVLNQKQREQFGDFIHRFELGESKLRMSKAIQLKPTKQFHSIMCVTAEQPLAEDNVIGGVLTRVFEIPLDGAIGDFDATTKQFKTNHDFCREIYQSTEENFGFIGLEFVRRLEEDPTEFDRLKADFNQMRAEIVKTRKDESLASHIDYVAALSVAYDRFLRWILNLNDKDAADKTFEFAFELASKIKTKKELSDSERALKFVQDVYLENNSCFVDATEYIQAFSNAAYHDDVKDKSRPSLPKIPKPYYGFFNNNDGNDSASMNQIAFVPKSLKDALKNAGFSPAKILKEFADSGITDHNPNRIDKKIEDPITGKRTYFIIFIDLFNDNEQSQKQTESNDSNDNGLPPEQSPF